MFLSVSINIRKVLCLNRFFFSNGSYINQISVYISPIYILTNQEHLIIVFIDEFIMLHRLTLVKIDYCKIT